MSDGAQRWTLASVALRLLKVDATLKGLLVSSAYGPVQQAFVDLVHKQFSVTPVPSSVSMERLTGALDIGLTLAAGKPVYQKGLLDSCEGAILVLGAERLDTITTATLSAHSEKSGTSSSVMVLMDESTPEENSLADTAIADRLALMIELPSLSMDTLQKLIASEDDTNKTNDSDESLKKKPSPASSPRDVKLSDALLQELALLADRLGVDSARTLLFATRVAKAHAFIHAREDVNVEDAAIAAQLALAPRATGTEAFEEQNDSQDDLDDDIEQQPEQAEQQQDQPPPSEPDTVEDPDDAERDESPEDMAEQLLDAARATLPQHLIASLVRGQKNTGKAGRDKGASGKGRHGRPSGVRRPRGSLAGQRLNILETLKTAAPKQRLREVTENYQGMDRQRLQVRVEDFRVTRFKQPVRTTTVFVVDASGSAALHRLAEAKGAVELLLAECYVRRDRVALISFRGTQATLDLPPTRSLVRAKRELAGLPGGGGTPLAMGLELAAQLAQQLKQAGETPVLVIMTDGKANITRAGEAVRSQAMEESHQVARQIAASKVRTLYIDTAVRARPPSRELARSLNASYLPLPSASSSTLPELIRG